jgi:hypothetical protein
MHFFLSCPKKLLPPPKNLLSWVIWKYPAGVSIGGMKMVIKFGSR